MYDLIQVNSIKAYEAFQYMGVKPSKANINSWGGGGGYCKAYIYPGEDSEENLIILLPKSYFKLHTFIHMHH